MSGQAPRIPLHGDPDPFQAPARIALATAQAGGPELFAQLVRELSAGLDVALVFVAVAAQDARRTLRTIAVSLDGTLRPDFDCPDQGLPQANLPPGAYQFVPSGLLPQLQPESLFAEEAMESMAVLALNDSSGEPLGLLVAMDRRPMDAAAAGHVEAMLRVVAARAAAELERARADETLRSVARAVSASRSGSVFDELVRLLATILHVDVAFIAQHEAAQPEGMRVLAMYCNGTVLQDLRYALAGSPCATVFGQRFRAYPAGLPALFPGDREMRELGPQS